MQRLHRSRKQTKYIYSPFGKFAERANKPKHSYIASAIGVTSKPNPPTEPETFGRTYACGVQNTGQDAVRDTDRGDGESDDRVGLDRGTGLVQSRLQGSDQEEGLQTRAGQ